MLAYKNRILFFSNYFNNLNMNLVKHNKIKMVLYIIKRFNGNRLKKLRRSTTNYQFAYNMKTKY